MASCSFTHTGRTFTLTVENTTYSIANNNSNVSWTLSISGGGTQWYDTYAKATINGNVVYNQTSSWNTGTFPAKDGSVSGTVYNIPHDAEGRAVISFALEGYSQVYSTQYANGVLELTNIPRQANITGAIDVTDEQNPRFTFYNPAGFNLIAELEINPTNTHLFSRTIPNTGSYTFELTDDERKTLRTYLKNNKSTLRYLLYSNNRQFVSYVDKAINVVNANPTFTDFEYSDLGGMTPNGTVTNILTGDDSVIIKGYSTLYVLITDEAVAKKEATISYYQVDDVRETVGEIKPIQIQVPKYNKSDITCLAIDSRGNSASVTKQITNFIDYFDPIKNTFTLSRSDNGIGEFVNLNINGSFWNGNFGAVNNELKITYKFKKTTDNEYTIGTTTITPTLNENNFSYNNLIAGDTEQNGFDINDSYDVEVTIEDKINKVIVQSVIGAGIPAIAIYKNKASLGDKYDTYLGGTQLWGDVYLNGSKLGNNYSTEEQLIGTWFGKPLYQKVFELGVLNSMTQLGDGGERYKTYIGNYNNAISCEMIIVSPNDNNRTITEKADFDGPAFTSWAETDNGNLLIYVYRINNVHYSEWLGYATVRYTKTENNAQNITLADEEEINLSEEEL